MMEKTCVTVSRKWNNPQIKTTVSKEGISLEMSMENFVKALKQEVGSVRWTFKKATFEKQLDEAVKIVIRGIKDESTKIM